MCNETEKAVDNQLTVEEIATCFPELVAHVPPGLLTELHLYLGQAGANRNMIPVMLRILNKYRVFEYHHLHHVDTGPYVNLRVPNFTMKDVVAGARFRYLRVAVDLSTEPIWVGASRVTLKPGETIQILSRHCDSVTFLLGEFGTSDARIGILSLAVLTGGTSSGVLFELVGQAP
jgi:hypothetical protein